MHCDLCSSEVIKYSCGVVHMTVIPAPKRGRQEDQEVKVVLSCVANSSLILDRSLYQTNYE